MPLQWSYELLVFMVLLNFLLAIIVDAFSEVRQLRDAEPVMVVHSSVCMNQHCLRPRYRPTHVLLCFITQVKEKTHETVGIHTELYQVGQHTCG
jgi:hypothetical protein